MGYLQLNVMDHQKLIEKHAAALGLKDVKVSWFKFNGPTAVNEALISGNVDIGSGGVPGLLTLWARTKGTPQEVRGISALSSQPFLLNTRDPKIKTMKDFKDSRPHRGAGGKILGAGAHPANRSDQALWRQGLREIRSADRVDDAARRHRRFAERRRPDLRGVQRAAVPVHAARRQKHSHGAQFVRRDGRLAHLHGDLDLEKIPRRQSHTVQSVPRRAEGSDRLSSNTTRSRRQNTGSQIPNRSCRPTPLPRSSAANRCTGRWCRRTP